MKKKTKPGAIQQLLSYAGNNKKQLYLSTFLATLGELFGMAPFITVSLLVAELFNKTATISYIIYMVLAAFSGTYIPFLFFSNQTLEQYAGMFGESYLGILQTLVSPVTAIIMLVVVAICAFVGALIAKKLLKKHFKKAGMV